MGFLRKIGEAVAEGWGHQSQTTNLGSMYGDGKVHTTYKESPEEKYDNEQVALRASKAQEEADAATKAKKKSTWQKMVEGIQKANEDRAAAAKARLNEPQQGTLPRNALKTIKTLHPNWSPEQITDELARIAGLGINKR